LTIHDQRLCCYKLENIVASIDIVEFHPLEEEHHIDTDNPNSAPDIYRIGGMSINSNEKNLPVSHLIAIPESTADGTILLPNVITLFLKMIHLVKQNKKIF